MSRPVVRTLLSSVILAGPMVLRAQTGYYNLDVGRPNRVEDAAATALYSLDLQLASLRAERLAGGVYRYRTEPKISYGILPFTEVELRVPVVRVEPPRGSGAPAITGVASVGLAALRTLMVETSRVPALAIGGEVLLPYGALAPPDRSFFVKALATKTTSLLRISLNAGTGTYSVQAPAPQPADTTCPAGGGFRFQLPGTPAVCNGAPLIFDVPCSRAPTGSTTLRALAFCSVAPTDSAVARTTPSRGTHWVVGLGGDRAFALRSTLVSADLVAERFVGLYDRVDWTGEIGARHQLTPHVVLDAGAARHFAGVLRSTSLGVGATVELPTRPWAW